MRAFFKGRRKLKPRHLRAAAWIIAILVGGFIIQQVRHEGTVREDQFCDLFLSAHNDKVLRLKNTEDFLNTAAGKEPTALNKYIRKVSLPQTRIEVAKEKANLPETCLDEEAPK